MIIEHNISREATMMMMLFGGKSSCDPIDGVGLEKKALTSQESL